MTDSSRDLHAVIVEMKNETVHLLLPFEAKHVLDFLMKSKLSMSITERVDAIEVTFWETTAQ